MGIKHRHLFTAGFTIVEMMIVVIVIGIIVGITVVSYSAITRSSNEQSLKKDLQSTASKLTRYRADHGGYPASLQDVDVEDTSTTNYTYTYGPVTDTYCLAATAYNMDYYVQSGTTDPKEGEACPVVPN